MLGHGLGARLGIMGSLRATPICVLWFRFITASLEPGTQAASPRFSALRHGGINITIPKDGYRLRGQGGRILCVWSDQN
jgi:hypothetical protein